MFCSTTISDSEGLFKFQVSADSYILHFYNYST